MTISKHTLIRMASIGDLLFTVKPRGNPERGLEALSDEIKVLFASCDIVFANLESTLPGIETVITEPRIISSEKQMLSLKNAGINAVTLGNNHAFDCYEDGFYNVSNILDKMKIPWCGAGLNIQEASQPLIMQVNGIKMGFLCVVDKSSGPSHFADESKMGVAPLDIETTCRNIKALKEKVDHVIVSPHWGMERFRIPSPEQIEQAHDFVDAGASMVVGHHPHVLQGMKIYKGAPIAYSLGNFLPNKIYWENGDFFTWSRFERTSCILLCEINKKGVFGVKQIPVFDDGKKISIEKTGWGDACLNKVNSLLEQGVTRKEYEREAFRVNVIKPILSHLTWTGIKRIRPHHFGRLFKKIIKKI